VGIKCIARDRVMIRNKKKAYKIRLEHEFKNIFIPKANHNLVPGNFISNEKYCAQTYWFEAKKPSAIHKQRTSRSTVYKTYSRHRWLLSFILYFSNRASSYNSGRKPPWGTVSSTICLSESSTRFVELCAHPQDNCINP